MALKGKHILLTPDNMALPKLGLQYLQQLLIKNNGVLYEDKYLKIFYKSEFRGSQGRSALRIQSQIGKITSFKINLASDGGVKLYISKP